MNLSSSTTINESKCSEIVDTSNSHTSSKVLDCPDTPVCDFQNHFVIKKKPEVVSNRCHNEEQYYGDAHPFRDKPKVALPNMHTYRLSSPEKHPDDENYSRLVSTIFEEDVFESDYSGKSKVKLLIEKYNKTAKDCNNNDLLHPTNVEFSGAVHKRIIQADTVINMGDMQETLPTTSKSEPDSEAKLDTLASASVQKFINLRTRLNASKPRSLTTSAEDQNKSENNGAIEQEDCFLKHDDADSSQKPVSPSKKPLYPFSFKNRNISTPLEDNSRLRAFGPNRPSTAPSLKLSSPFSTMGKSVGPNHRDYDDATSPMDKNYFPIQKYIYSHGDAILSKSSKEQSPEEAVLHLCKQKSPIPIHLIFDGLKDIRKVGEGVFGECFRCHFVTTDAMGVYKVVPIQGESKINGENQKKFAEIFPEIAISRQLSKLHEGYQECSAKGYIRMHNVRIAQGAYPGILEDKWHSWDAVYKSDNDPPEFPNDQLYMVFEFEYGGQDAEAFVFKNARQAFYLSIQIAHILAVGENAVEFEHRDLHWGNILVKSTESEHVSYKVKGEEIQVTSSGVEACIIDFTIARIVDDKGIPIYLDLKNDEEQFLGTGDHQFDIYRMMRDFNRNEWAPFCPKTNTFWVHYLAEKLLTNGRYLDKESIEHHFFSRQLCKLKDTIMRHDSCSSFVMHKSCADFKVSESPIGIHFPRTMIQEKGNKFNIVY